MQFQGLESLEYNIAFAKMALCCLPRLGNSKVKIPLKF